MDKRALFFTLVILTFTVSGCGALKPLSVLGPESIMGDKQNARQELEINAVNYPKVDGSSSTFPLSMMIACHFTELPCIWTDWMDETRIMLPDVTDYQGEFPELSHQGTHGSYENLIKSEADLILVARLPSTDELNLATLRGVELEAVPIALDAFVFVVNIDNPIDNLSIKDIRDIYSGDITNWSEFGVVEAPIQPYRRNDNSGSEVLMQNLVMNGVPSIEVPEMVITSMIALIDQVAEDPNGIGYSVYYYEQFIAPNPQLKLVGVDGIVPSEESIRTNTYPFTTEVYAVMRRDLATDSPAYQLRNWLLSSEGQNVVSESGYVPIRS